MFEKETLEPQEEAVVSAPAVTEQPESPAAEHPEPEKPKEKDVHAMKRINERLARERDEALARIAAMEAKKNAPDPQEDDGAINIGNDDLAEGKHLHKMASQIKRLNEKLERQQRESITMSAEARLRYEYPDLDKVVCKENLESLSETYPELATTLNSSSDFYAKAKSAYTLIKKLGIHVDDTYEKDRELAQKNASKPKPLVSVSPQQGDSPLSRANAFANGLTDELKAQLYKEMVESRKGY